jgi:hypothetical protein
MLSSFIQEGEKTRSNQDQNLAFSWFCPDGCGLNSYCSFIFDVVLLSVQPYRARVPKRWFTPTSAHVHFFLSKMGILLLVQYTRPLHNQDAHSRTKIRYKSTNGVQRYNRVHREIKRLARRI